MKVYCAETEIVRQYGENKTKYSYKLPLFNILFSFYYIKTIEPYLKIANNILVDSGGYSFQTTKKKLITPEKYFKDYKKFIETVHDIEKVQGIFELDIDNMVGYEQVKEYRAELFEITPKIIPVWHKSLGIQEYKKMCQEYDYIAIPCTRNRAIKQNYYGNFIKYAHNNKCKVHGLGMLKKKILDKIPFDSVDGTSWLRSTRFGDNKGKKLNSQFINQNKEKLCFFELVEHIQYQEKMRKRWENYQY